MAARSCMASARPSGPSSATWPRWLWAKAAARSRASFRSSSTPSGPLDSTSGSRSQAAASRAGSTVVLTTARLEEQMADLPTPLEPAPPALAGGRQLLLKSEDTHELGAFKWRGALPSLERYRDAGATAVITASTGNHGAATAWAARRTGLRAIVYVPERASQAKLDLLAELGAELRHAGVDVDEAKDEARRHAERDELPFFEDGADSAQFEGYAAIGRELIEQLGERPVLTIVPVGNGALLIGIARGLGDGGSTLGVVSKAAPVMALSVEAGRPVESDQSATFADGLAGRVGVPPALEGR